MKTINSNLLSTFFNINKFIKDFENGKNRIVQNDGSVYRSNYLFFYTYLLNEKLKSDPYSTIITDYMQKCERYFPGSSYYLLKKTIGKLNGSNNDTYVDHKLKTNMESLKNYIVSNSNEKMYNLFIDVLTLGGPDATIISDYDNVEKVTVQRKDNVDFNIEIAEKLHNSLFSLSSKKTTDVVVSVADAFIERESDLIPLIDHANKNKCNLLVVCRGISDYAIKAIKNIMIKNNILIYIYVEKFNNSDPFKLEDFSRVTGTEIISSDKMHSFLKHGVDCSKIIHSVTLTKDTIQLNTTCNNLIEEINNQISNTKDENLKKYLNTRKQRIASKKVYITVPPSEKLFLQNIKDIINSYNNITKFGMVKLNNNEYDCYESQKLTDKLSESLFKNITKTTVVIKA
jgi:uncharacterized protein YsxB (DUF464 family)